jgi:hypothetical protein
MCMNLVTSGRQSFKRNIVVYTTQLSYNSAAGTFSQDGADFVYRIQEVHTVPTHTHTCRVEPACIHLVALRVQYWLLSNGCAAILAWDYFVNYSCGLTGDRMGGEQRF